MGVYIKNWSIADWKELLKWAKIGANNAMIGEFSEVEEVPPHGRLGDLDKLEKMFADIDSAPYSCFDGAEPFYSAEDAAHIIRLAPTVIEADVSEEELQREYEANVEYAQYCERYEPTYDPNTGAM